MQDCYYVRAILPNGNCTWRFHYVGAARYVVDSIRKLGLEAYIVGYLY